jgi:hypothetical protein
VSERVPQQHKNARRNAVPFMNDVVTRGHEALQGYSAKMSLWYKNQVEQSFFAGSPRYKKSGIMVMYCIASSSGQSFPLKLVSDFTS